MHNNTIIKEIGMYFEDFIPGDIIYHAASKTIFESDNNIFSLITMNHHPVHTNIDYASHNQHGKVLVVGTLVFSLVVGITVPDISGKAIANLMYENIEHLSPVFLNDTIYAKTEILEAKESNSKKDRGIIYVETTAYNQDKEDVLRFRRRVLVKRRG
ncbi:MAG TPA: MaoC family dehydratase [Bacteroidales bacterium]|nr:MaoC family dehydratase [Bacteroidales bacterium]MDD4235101.1 MaoC family dehydratase [Bacteroidales bacterium]MDY0159835.1 MaoC family dehydratase [Bacteroidales bacterium]HRW20551.1 MaoC family dehydratase [Bacteroidales bacterium]HXK81913.1 MaoC family dehydratase [Bacteroidales bacterium]